MPKKSRTDHYFIYCKDHERKYTGSTVCVILREGLMFHGESFCSPKDQFNKKIGRSIAFARAIEAYEKYKENCLANA